MYKKAKEKHMTSRPHDCTALAMCFHFRKEREKEESVRRARRVDTALIAQWLACCWWMYYSIASSSWKDTNFMKQITAIWRATVQVYNACRKDFLHMQKMRGLALCSTENAGFRKCRLHGKIAIGRQKNSGNSQKNLYNLYECAAKWNKTPRGGRKKWHVQNTGKFSENFYFTNGVPCDMMQ